MEDLDKLAADFAARGYEPEGAELEHDGMAAGDTHDHEPPAAAPGTARASAASRTVATTSRSSRATRS